MTKIVAHGKKDGIDASLYWDSDKWITIEVICEDEDLEEPAKWEEELEGLQRKEYSFSGDFLSEKDPVRIFCIMNEWFDERPLFLSDPPLPFLREGYEDPDADKVVY